MSNYANRRKSNIKTLLIVLSLTALVAYFFIYYGMIKPSIRNKEIKFEGTYLTSPTEIKAFSLTDNHNSSFTEKNLVGHWTMMFFGFTNCGMVCPTTMAALNTMYKTLQTQLPDNQLPQILFVSVDPDRDTVSRINDYVTAFNPHFIGARTDINHTIALERALHIVAAKIQVDGMGKNNYTINHSAEILLINPKGELQAYLSYPHEAHEMVKAYHAIISKG